MKWLITGADGQLGRCLQDRLADKAGHEVKLYDTTFFDTGKETGDFYQEELGQVIKVDLGSKGVVRKKMDEQNIIFRDEN